MSVQREFTNELGNRIRITIEGPTSTSENILSATEVRHLRDALSEHSAPPAVNVDELAREIATEYADEAWGPHASEDDKRRVKSILFRVASGVITRHLARAKGEA